MKSNEAHAEGEKSAFLLWPPQWMNTRHQRWGFRWGENRLLGSLLEGGRRVNTHAPSHPTAYQVNLGIWMAPHCDESPKTYVAGSLVELLSKGPWTRGDACGA
jgi:hypothetical protein